MRRYAFIDVANTKGSAALLGFQIDSQKLYEYLSKNGINHRNTTKIIVAANDEEISALETLMMTGKNNGLKGLELITGKRVMELEPEVSAAAGIFIPSTGILDTHSLMKNLMNEASAKGALVSFDSKVTGIEKTMEGYRLTIGEDGYEFVSGTVINSAGLGSGDIAALAGMDIDKLGYRIYPCKGSYFRSNIKFNINRLIYPVPSHNVHNLGIHLTIDLTGSTRFGPDASYVDEMDYSVNEASKEGFYNAIRKYLPSITMDSLYPDTSGIRPKTQCQGGPFRDFVIKEESDNGFPGFINLIGIESPGLTSCLAIAEFVEKLV